MVTLRKKIVNGRAYYYLQHTVRAGKTVTTKEKYLGRSVPEDVEALKRGFLAEVYKARFYSAFERIRQNYAKELRGTPRSLLEKQAKTFSVRFTYDTNRIEGSTLTYRETADLLERGMTPASKPIRYAKEAEAHAKLFSEMLRCEGDLDLGQILRWHKDLLGGTAPDIAGKIRQHKVEISGSRFVPPLPVELQPLLLGFFKWYAKSKSGMHPVELATLVHLKFVTIHPFGDGNGRMSRLLMNFVLNKRGFPLLNIPYEKRAGYYRALERSQLRGNEDIFLQWLFRKYLKEYKRYAEEK
ncbi:MAG: Fic family protein [archaeon]